MRKIVLAGAAVFLAGGSAVLIVATTGAASTGCGRPPVTSLPPVADRTTIVMNGVHLHWVNPGPAYVVCDHDGEPGPTTTWGR